MPDDDLAPTPLDYRAPRVAVGSCREQTYRLLVQSRRLDAGALLLRLAIGVPLTLLAPAALATLFWVVCRRSNVALPIGYPLVLAVFCAAFVPILMMVERRTGGGYYAEAARGLTHPRDIKSRGEWELNQAEAAWYAYVEIALTGPRLLWEAIDHLRGRSGLTDADAAMAAELVEHLRAAGAAVAVRDLVAPHRPPDDVHRAVALLKQLDWADTSADGRRVWLRTDAAKRLDQ